MPTPSTYRPHRLALAIALSLGCIDVSMAQQPEIDAAVEAPDKKARTTAWRKSDDLLAIRNFIGPMQHAVKPASLKPQESVIQPPTDSAAPEPVDLAAHLYDFPETADDSLPPPSPATPEGEPGPVSAEVPANPAPPVAATTEPIDPAEPLYELPGNNDVPLETVDNDLPMTFDEFSNADGVKRTTAAGRYESIDGVSLTLGWEMTFLSSVAVSALQEKFRAVVGKTQYCSTPPRAAYSTKPVTFPGCESRKALGL